jgi:hypothetical protein
VQLQDDEANQKMRVIWTGCPLSIGVCQLPRRLSLACISAGYGICFDSRRAWEVQITDSNTNMRSKVLALFDLPHPAWRRMQRQPALPAANAKVSLYNSRPASHQ